MTYSQQRNGTPYAIWASLTAFSGDVQEQRPSAKTPPPNGGGGRVGHF